MRKTGGFQINRGNYLSTYKERFDKEHQRSKASVVSGQENVEKSTYIHPTKK